MSLGIKQAWRARPLSIRDAGNPLIPRGSPGCGRGPWLPWVRRRLASGLAAASAASAAAPDAGKLGDARRSALSPRRAPEMDAAPPMRIAPALQPESMHDAMKRQFLDTLLYDVEEDAQAIEAAVTTGSVMDKGSVVYASVRETNASRQRQHRALWQQLRLDEIRKGKGKDTADWRKVLTILSNRAPKVARTLSQASRTLVVTRQVADRLLYGTDQTIWDIAERTDCRLDMDESSASASLRPPGKRIVLMGFDHAVEAAKAEIAYIAGQPLPATSSTSIQKNGSRKSKPRRWTSTKPLEKPGFTPEWTILYKFEDYPRPLYWTPETFEAYVTALVRAKMPPYKATELYGSGMKAREAVLHLIMDVFQSRETRSSLSTSAFKTVLKWMGSHGVVFRPQVRELFVRMEAASLPMDVEVFNTLLTGNMRLDDLRNFGSIVSLMARRGYVPTLKTWSLFLAIVKNNEVEQHVLRAMNERGLLDDPRASRMIATRFIMHDLQQARGNWSGLSAFIDSQNQKYGFGWITTASFNNMLNELGRQGKLASDDDLAHLPANTGSRIAHLYRKRYSRASDWHPARPLHVLFAEALEADRDLERRRAADPVDEHAPRRIKEQGLPLPLVARRPADASETRDDGAREASTSSAPLSTAAETPAADSQLYMTIFRRTLSAAQRRAKKKKMKTTNTDTGEMGTATA
ncbi:conserved hypothetical protein [Verticillium alfalfae VaMs.102]|uniref:Pentatricopeptide repeat domain-containing protein n=1 Tax=Verticillium alfalfae (strain VaMs.102 / ATCC MYA-4576 / FGSC 10136) TaxID=526221 RepID=C9S5S1_VERA1|nr:conserved hypothetical protein [Verticillium alfalfae VaMs.102]EEY14297.1 conserved hypothetical protein [Verticillium alfalfae VaMs.102]